MGDRAAQMILIMTRIPIMGTGKWLSDGTIVRGYKSAAVAEIKAPEDPESLAAALEQVLQAKENDVSRCFVLWHVSGGSEVAVDLLHDRRLRQWSGQSVTFHRSDRIGNAVAVLKQTATSADCARFQETLDSLRQALLAGTAQSRDVMDRSRITLEMLGKAFDRRQPPISFLQHRLSGTLGALLIALADWVEDPTATGIQRFLGNGKLIAAEARGILLGDPICEWQRATGFPSVVEVIPVEQRESARETLEGHLKRSLGKLGDLETLLKKLDDSDPGPSRTSFVDNDAVGAIRKWIWELETVLAEWERGVPHEHHT